MKNRYLLLVCTLVVPLIGIMAGIITQKNVNTPLSTTEEKVLDNTTAQTDGNHDEIVVLIAGERSVMKLNDYLTGVLLCEIPAGFHPQAKMAQAVVARTYALRTAQMGQKHGVGVVCADPDCCQGYISPQVYAAKWDTTAPVEQAREAVENTQDRVITWNGALIDATYFSCSGGLTESAAAVWGADVPYLQSTESPGEEGADHFVETKRFDPDEFCEKLGISSAAPSSQWLTFVSYTPGGGIREAEICGKTFSGTQLRQLLALRSTCISFSFLPDSVVCTAKGYGHRVGMSQYGANAMANSGHSWVEIIQHYYQSVEIE